MILLYIILTLTIVGVLLLALYPYKISCNGYTFTTITGEIGTVLLVFSVIFSVIFLATSMRTYYSSSLFPAQQEKVISYCQAVKLTKEAYYDSKLSALQLENMLQSTNVSKTIHECQLQKAQFNATLKEYQLKKTQWLFRGLTFGLFVSKNVLTMEPL